MNENTAMYMQDFGLPAAWTPRNGDPIVIGKAIMDLTDTGIVYEGFSAQGTEIYALVETSVFGGLRDGDALTVGSNDYRVRESRRIDDGAFTRVRLAKFN